MPSDIERVTSRELAESSQIVDSAGRTITHRDLVKVGDSIIKIHLGPGQTPEIAHILRSAWPSLADLNYDGPKEFHVRLRQHRASCVLLVYASVTNTKRLPSIFGEVVQRGRLCRTREQAHAAIESIKRELGI